MMIHIQDDVLRLSRAGVMGKLLMDKTAGGRILWGTDAYRDAGIVRGAEMGETGLSLIRTRARKAFEQQSERTRQHGEVFTPRWVVDRMIDAIDADFFGTAAFDKAAFQEPRTLFHGEKEWRAYVDSKRLEIACGEAPYLCERYDVAMAGSCSYFDNFFGMRFIISAFTLW